jgi:hypothetical protein
MLLAAALAFARPVMTPSGGSKARVVLVDRSRAVADPADVMTRAKAAVAGDPLAVLIAFDTSARVITRSALDSFAHASPSQANGSLSAAFALARREATRLASKVDSVELVAITPVATGETDSATLWLRAQWPGGTTLERVALRTDSSTVWRLEHALNADDPLAPALRSIPVGNGAAAVRLVRGPLSGTDSAFARTGGTVVRWDTINVHSPSAQGLSAGDEVIVAMLGRSAVSVEGATVAHWADGSAAAREAQLGSGCVREVGIGVPLAGDLPLHAPFQRMVRRLVTPCGARTASVAADASIMDRVFGKKTSAAPSNALRTSDAPATPLVKWLLGAAILLALLELFARRWMKQEVPA